MQVADRGYYCGGAGCGGILLASALCVVVAGGLAYRYGPHWLYLVLRPRAPGVIIHHSATAARAGGRQVNAAVIDEAHSRRGWEIRDSHNTYHIGYHFVILPDGTIERGRPEWMPGAHARGNNQYLGVCLVGNFSSVANPSGAQQPARPTTAQLTALNTVLKQLMDRHSFSPADVHAHSEFGATECPGDRFDIEQVRRRLTGSSG